MKLQSYYKIRFFCALVALRVIPLLSSTATAPMCVYVCMLVSICEYVCVCGVCTRVYVYAWVRGCVCMTIDVENEAFIE